MGRVGREEEERRHRERLDVPHDVAVVVVIVRPVREPEQRRACQRCRVGRAQQVEDAGVGDRLPASVRPVELDPSPPQLFATPRGSPAGGRRNPRFAPTAASRPACSSGRACDRHGNGRRQQADAVATVGPCTEPVRRREPASLIARWPPPARASSPRNDVVYAMPSVEMSPDECHSSRPSTPSFGPWSWGWATSSAYPGTPVGSIPARKRNVGRAVDPDLDIAGGQGGHGPGTEGSGLDRRGRAVDPERSRRYAAPRSRSRSAARGAGSIREPQKPRRRQPGRRPRGRRALGRIPRRRRWGQGPQTR